MSRLPVVEHLNLPDNSNIREMRVSVFRQVKGGTATRQACTSMRNVCSDHYELEP